MAQRLTAWVQSHILDLVDVYWLSRTTPSVSQATHNDQPNIVSTRRSSESEQSTYIHKLPVEVLCELLKYLEWRDLLSASSTCRVWYRATQSRQLWLILAMDLQSTHGIARLEEPAGEYTTPELRDWVLRRLRAQDAWKADTNALNFRPRRIELPDLQHTVLVPGGRWLLATDESGRLLSYDLDSSEDKTPCLLVDPSQREAKLGDMFQISYWIDYSRQKLSLRVALWEFDAEFSDMDYTTTCIYQVNLLGHGEDAYLDAQFLAVVRGSKEAVNFAVALDGEYLLECWVPESNEDRNLSLLRYTSGGADRLERSEALHSRLATPYIADGLYITPTGYIIIFGGDHVDIYTIQQLQDSDETARMNLSPVHRIPCHALFHCAAPFISQHTWLVCGHEGKIYLTLIPQLGSDKGSFTKTMLCEQNLYEHNDHRTLLTATASLFLHRDWTMDLVIYSWDSNMNTSCFSRSVHIPNLYNMYGTFFGQLSVNGHDKGVGRIILDAFQHGHFFVLDVIP